MPTFAQISVHVPRVSGVYDYHIPPQLEGQVIPGCLVTVPFGRQTVQGIVLALAEVASVPETRPVEALLDPQPVVTPQQMSLAAHMATETCSTLSACLNVMLPVGLSQQADTLFQLTDGAQTFESMTPLQKRLVALLQKRGSLRGRQIDAAIPRLNWRDSTQALVRRNMLQAQPVLPPPSVRPKFTRTAQLAAPPEEWEPRLVKSVRNKPGSPIYNRRLAVLQFLQTESLPVNLPWVYASSGANLQDLYRLADAGLITLSENEVWRDPLAGLTYSPSQPPRLTTDQESVWKEVSGSLAALAEGARLQPHLLLGVTGSGKTEIYLQAMAEILRQGRQAVVLVPEISLTPQTVRRFLARFPGQVGLLHSRLSPGERYDTWRRLRDRQLNIVVGPRSALFAPLPDPGLIVIDECEDDAYYQGESPPHYDSIRTAQAYADISRSLLLLGSATPSVELLHRAKSQNWPILRLPARICAHRHALELQSQTLHTPLPDRDVEGEAATLPLPPVQVVDMRAELKQGNRSLFSQPLQAALEDVLKKRQQAILFINRRGQASYVFCRECGQALRCPRCDLPLTYHQNPPGLVCHHCRYTRQMPAECPHCRSRQIKQYGTGTEAVEKALKELFPQAETLRWDAETSREKGAHELLLAHFARHHADILVGTQMIAKGLDMPLVTLVGVVLADVGLNLPDFRAGERTFRLLTQVAGRAGRSPLGGRVVLQTYLPDHYAIQAASRHDLEGFYRQELEMRRQMGYPPFSRLARWVFSSTDQSAAEEAAIQAAGQLRHQAQILDLAAPNLIGPAPCFYQRLNSIYRWQVILRSADPVRWLERAQFTAKETRSVSIDLEIDPPSLL